MLARERLFASVNSANSVVNFEVQISMVFLSTVVAKYHDLPDFAKRFTGHAYQLAG